MSFPWAMLANQVVASREAASTGPASASRRCERSTCLRSVMSLPISAMAWGAPRSCWHPAQRLVTTRGAPSRRVWTGSPSQWAAHRTSASIASHGCGNWVCDSFRHGPGQQKSADQNEHGPRCRKVLQGYGTTEYGRARPRKLRRNPPSPLPPLAEQPRGRKRS